jgi:hypothetical protein
VFRSCGASAPQEGIARPEHLFLLREEMVFDHFEKIEGKHWSLVQTRPRNEKYAAAHCEMNGIVVYLPLITKLEIHNRSKRILHLPMFPGYVFACPSKEEETEIRRNKSVWNLKVLSEVDEDGLLRDLEIVRESEILSEKQELVVNPGLHIGETYIMKKAPFKGQEVVLVRRKNAVSVIVNLFFLGRNIEIVCGADELTS